MDIRVYFQKLQELEQSLPAPWALVISTETTNGGKPGVATEVNREVAARLILAGNARLATEAEAEEFRTAENKARADADQARMAGRLQLAVLSEQEIRALKSSLRPQRG